MNPDPNGRPPARRPSRRSRETLARGAAFVIGAALWSCAGAPPAACGEAIKVGDEVVVMANGPGEALRGMPAVARGVTAPDGAAATGQDVFLVTWQEGWHGEQGNSRIYAARVNPDGKVLDPQGIEIAPCATGVQENPRVAFVAGTFLVVWQDLRNGRDCDVLGARVSPAGKVLDQQPIQIAVGPRTQAMPDVTVDDQGFMVAWHGFQADESVPRIFAAHVAPNGSMDQPLVLDRGASPRIAWNGKDYLVACFDASMLGANNLRRIVTFCMGADGTVRSRSSPRENIGFQYSSPLSVCRRDESGWVLVCQRSTPDYWGWSGPGAQRVFSIEPDGTRAADSPSESYNDPKTRTQSIPSNWLDTSLSKPFHRALGPAAIPDVWPFGGSAVVQDRDWCLVVWQRYHTGGGTGIELINGDIRAGRVDGWQLLDEQGGVPVAASEAGERNPALAGDGSGRLLCAYEKTLASGATQICVRTIATERVPTGAR